MFPDLLWFSFHRRILGCCPGACESPETSERELHPSSAGRGVRFICFSLLSHAKEQLTVNFNTTSSYLKEENMSVWFKRSENDSGLFSETGAAVGVSLSSCR